MKVILIFYYLYASTSVMASELNFSDGSQKYVFDFDQKNMLILTKDCNKKCMAYESLRKIKIQQIKDGGASLGALICEKQLNGKIMILFDQSRDQNGFCMFSDKSQVALGSLQAVALKLK